MDEELMKSKFNQAICMEKSGELEECVKVLEELFAKLPKEKYYGIFIVMAFNSHNNFLEMFEYLKGKNLRVNQKDRELLERQPTQMEISNFLFFLYWRLGKKKEALKLGFEIAQMNILDLGQVIHILQSAGIANYHFDGDGDWVTYKFDFNGVTKKIELKNCTINLSSFDRLSPSELTISNVKFIRDGQEEKVVIANEFLDLKKINRLTLQCLEQKNLAIDFSEDISLDYLELWHVIVLNGEEVKWNIKEVCLTCVFFIRDGHELEQVTINEILDIKQIERLTLVCYEKKKNLVIDLNEDVSMDYLGLVNVEVLDWKEAKSTVENLELVGIPFVEKTKMKIKAMSICDSSDISCLPDTIQELELRGTVKPKGVGTTWSNISFLPERIKTIELLRNTRKILEGQSVKVNVFSSGKINLPDLKYLTLDRIDSSILSLFHAVPLTHIHFYSMRKIYFDELPEKVKQIKITKLRNKDNWIVGNSRVRKVDKLILEEMTLRKIGIYLRYFQTDELIICNSSIPSRELSDWMKKVKKRMAIGKIVWKEEDFRFLSRQVDRMSEYYSVAKGRGKGMEENEFKESLKLF